MNHVVGVVTAGGTVVGISDAGRPHVRPVAPAPWRRAPQAPATRVHLVDGTYELFRLFYGLRRFSKGEDRPFDAVIGVLNAVLDMIEKGATHIGVATDHVIESFRNELWAGYKTGEGIDPALWAQFHPLEEALRRDGSHRVGDGRPRG